MRKLNTAICALAYLTLLVTRGWGASNTPCPQMPALKHRLSFSTSAPEMQGKKKAFSSGGRGWRGRFELSTTKWGWKTFSDTGGLKREREREREDKNAKQRSKGISELQSNLSLHQGWTQMTGPNPGNSVTREQPVPASGGHPQGPSLLFALSGVREHCVGKTCWNQHSQGSLTRGRDLQQN